MEQLEEKLAAAQERREAIQRQRAAIALRLVEGDARAPAEMKVADRALSDVDAELAVLKMATSEAAKRAAREAEAAEAARVVEVRARINELVAQRQRDLEQFCAAIQSFETAYTSVAQSLPEIAEAYRSIGIRTHGVSALDINELGHRLRMLCQKRFGRWQGFGKIFGGSSNPAGANDFADWLAEEHRLLAVQLQ